MKKLLIVSVLAPLFLISCGKTEEMKTVVNPPVVEKQTVVTPPIVESPVVATGSGAGLKDETGATSNSGIPLHAQSPVGKSDCVTEKQFGESYDFLYTAGVKSPTFHFETDKGKISSIEIGEGEVIDISGVVDYLDPKTTSASFRWFDDSGNANFCKIDKEDPKYKSIKWKAPQVDSDLIITLGTQLQASNAPPVTSYLQINVINTDNSKSRGFTITQLINDQDNRNTSFRGFSNTRFKLVVYLDSPQEITKVNAAMKVSDNIPTSSEREHEWSSFSDEVGFKKISPTEYVVELDNYPYSYIERYKQWDIKLQIQNNRNIFAEKEILMVPIPVMRKSYSVIGTMTGFSGTISGWGCFRERGNKIDVACGSMYGFDNKVVFRAESDERYLGKDLEAYAVLQKEGMEDIVFNNQSYIIETKKTEDELRKLGVISRAVLFHSINADESNFKVDNIKIDQKDF